MEAEDMKSAYMTSPFVCQISRRLYIHSMSVTHNNITIFILQVTSIHSGFEPLSDLIQEQRYTKKFKTAI
jgi:hypothetical protein